jgi:hypothetical protein
MITMLRSAIARFVLAVPMSGIAAAQRPAPVAEIAERHGRRAAWPLAPNRD